VSASSDSEGSQPSTSVVALTKFLSDFIDEYGVINSSWSFPSSWIDNIEAIVNVCSVLLLHTMCNWSVLMTVPSYSCIIMIDWKTSTLVEEHWFQVTNNTKWIYSEHEDLIWQCTGKKEEHMWNWPDCLYSLCADSGEYSTVIELFRSVTFCT